MTPAEEFEAVTARLRALGLTGTTDYAALALVEAAGTLREAGMHVDPVRLAECYMEDRLR